MCIRVGPWCAPTAHLAPSVACDETETFETFFTFLGGLGRAPGSCRKAHVSPIGILDFLRPTYRQLSCAARTRHSSPGNAGSEAVHGPEYVSLRPEAPCHLRRPRRRIRSQVRRSRIRRVRRRRRRVHRIRRVQRKVHEARVLLLLIAATRLSAVPARRWRHGGGNCGGDADRGTLFAVNPQGVPDKLPGGWEVSRGV